MPLTAIPTPVALIHAVDLPTGAKETWLLLRLLAGDKTSTPSASPYELCQLTGKSRTTLYEHLKRLQAAGFLGWHVAGRRLVICFPADDPAADAPDSVPNSEQPPAFVRISAPAPSGSVRESGCRPPSVRESAPKPPEIPDADLLFKDIKDSSMDSGGRKRAPRTHRSGRLPDLQNPDDPIQIYRAVFNFRPTPPQREEIYVQVHDPAVWRLTLEHWQLHAWSPRNLPGILELYARGGPSGCRCAQPATRRAPAPTAASTRGEALTSLIAERRRKDAHEAYLLNHDPFPTPPDSSTS